METILDKILSNVNLNEASQRVYQNRGIGGVDGMDVFELKSYLKENGEVIKEQIRKRKYKPQPVLRVEIPKDNGGVRQLGIPTTVDRVIQQSIHQVLSPIYETSYRLSEEVPEKTEEIDKTELEYITKRTDKEIKSAN